MRILDHGSSVGVADDNNSKGEYASGGAAALDGGGAKIRILKYSNIQIYSNIFKDSNSNSHSTARDDESGDDDSGRFPPETQRYMKDLADRLMREYLRHKTSGDDSVWQFTRVDAIRLRSLFTEAGGTRRGGRSPPCKQPVILSKPIATRRTIVTISLEDEDDDERYALVEKAMRTMSKRRRRLRHRHRRDVCFGEGLTDEPSLRSTALLRCKQEETMIEIDDNADDEPEIVILPTPPPLIVDLTDSDDDDPSRCIEF